MVSIHTFEMKIALRKSEQKQIIKIKCPAQQTKLDRAPL